MAQEETWDKEYQKPQLLTGGDSPRKDLKRYLKHLKKKEGVPSKGLSVLDLGSGNGRNGNYLAKEGASVIGLEISDTALWVAQSRARYEKLDAEYLKSDIGKPYPFLDNAFDLAIDVMSSNSLTEEERKVYLGEAHRVLKPGGHFFVRALSKDGDKNAKNLMQSSPGPEHDTYINTDMNLTERIFTEVDFRALYEPYFEIKELKKKTNYTRFKGTLYKRNYWLAYMKKRSD